MNYETAKALSVKLKNLNTAMNEVAWLVEKFENQEEKLKFRGLVADMMLDNCEFWRQIVHQYPDLDPDKGNV